MDAFDVATLRARLGRSGGAYLEFSRSADLSVGLYCLPAGGTDPQGPHTEEEVYWVVEGRAQIVVGEERRPVEPGAVFVVPAGVPHRFEAIESDLTVLVAFGPAEGSRARA